MLYQCRVEISSNRSFLCKNMVFGECVLSLYISVLWGLISPDGSIAQVTCSMLKEHLLKREWTLSIVVCLCTLSHAYLIRTGIYKSFHLLWVQFVHNSIWYFTHSVYLDNQQWCRVPTGSHPTLNNQTKLYSWHRKHQKRRRLCITLLHNSFLHDSEDTHLSEAYRRPQEQEFLWGSGKWVLKKENK